MEKYLLFPVVLTLSLITGCYGAGESKVLTKTDAAQASPDGVPAETYSVDAQEVNGRSSIPAPNIVLIMADDLGWGDVGFNGGEFQTPAIDRLAEEGVKLDRFYTYPACTQTRGALISGRRMRTVGLLEPMPPWTDAGLPLDIATLADRLRGHGYATWKIGKWHLGDHYVEQAPNARGYDHFYGHLGGEINYDTHVFASSLDWQRNGETIVEEGYSTHLLTREAVSLLETHPAGEPFFLDLSYNAPHTPLQAPTSALQKYEYISDPKRRRYAAMVSEMDQGIGEVIESILQREDAENTVIIFMSDNGGSLKHGASNGALRGGKASHYEGGIRVPAVIWWPSVIDPAVMAQVVSVHDLMPTILKLAGSPSISLRSYVGLNIWPAVAHQEEIKRDQPIVFALMMPGGPRKKSRYSASILKGDWKLIENMTFDRRAQSQDQRYTLVSRELFNLSTDPLEKQNLFESHPDMARLLSFELGSIPQGEPIGFVPPPPEWTLPLMPSSEPDFSDPIRPPAADAAKKRSLNRE